MYLLGTAQSAEGFGIYFHDYHAYCASCTVFIHSITTDTYVLDIKEGKLRVSNVQRDTRIFQNKTLKA
jgi:hypothetical protein